MKKTYLTLTALLLIGSFTTINAQNKSKKKAATQAPVVAPALTAVDSASYAFGFKIAQGLKADGVTSLNYAMLSKAMENVFKGDSSLLTDEQASNTIGSFLQAASKAKFSEAIATNEKFFTENKAKAGVKETASGLQYEVLTEGTGAKPKAEDFVTVRYFIRW